MIEESLLKSNFIGKDGFVWWIGQVAPPSVWRTKESRVDEKEGESWAYRCKVRIIGYHSFDANKLPDDKLPWAHVLTSAADGAPGQGSFGKTHQLVGGESVLGFFLDGEEGQQPVVVSAFYRSKAVKNDPEPGPFRPFTGMQGSLAASATRIKQPPNGKVQQTPTNTNSSGPAFTISQNSQLGVGGTTGLNVEPNYSSTSAADFQKTVGALRGLGVNLNTDQLFYDDVASASFLSAFKPVQNDNGCNQNYISQIAAYLRGFVKLINGLESTALGYIDPIRNKIVDVRQQVKKVARLVASVVKFIINGMRDNVIKLTGCLFRAFSITIPLPQWLQVSEATKNIMNLIFCLFERLFPLILGFIEQMLNNLIGRTSSIPLCAVEEAIAAIIAKLSDLIDDALSTVLSGLNWLVGGISQITSYITNAVNYLNQILSFLNCDSLACQSQYEWDPFKGFKLPNTDDWAKTIGKLNLLGSLEGGVDNWIGLLSMYGSSSTPFKACREEAVNPQSQSSVDIPIGTIFYKCIPPEIVIVGSGTGASAVAVVEPTNGSLLTIRVIDPGKGYTSKPSIYIIDNTGHGSGAEARATINANGNIESIYLIRSGSGYCQTDPNVGLGTTSSGITTTGIGTTSVGISTIPVGIVTSVVVDSPGYGYTSGDTISIGGCSYGVVVTNNGSIIGVTSASSCAETFNTTPALTINTNTGVGAQLYPVLQYVPQYIVDNPTLRVGIATDKIVNIDLCPE